MFEELIKLIQCYVWNKLDDIIEEIWLDINK